MQPARQSEAARPRLTSRQHGKGGALRRPCPFACSEIKAAPCGRQRHGAARRAAAIAGRFKPYACIGAQAIARSDERARTSCFCAILKQAGARTPRG